MDDSRLPTALWIEAHLATLNEKAVPHYILNKGNHASGVVLVKVIVRGGLCHFYQQQRDFMTNEMGWAKILGQEGIEEGEVDAYIHREISRDPDVWVIEIEGDNGENPFEGKVF